MRAIRVLDLFSGIGGFSLAAYWAGCETVAFCDIADFPSRVLAARWPNVPNYGDVRRLCRRAYDCEYVDEDVIWCPRCDMDFAYCQYVGVDEYVDKHGVPDVITAGPPGG